MPKKKKPQDDNAAHEASPPPESGVKRVYISFSAEVNQTTTEALLSVCAQHTQQGVDEIYLLLSTPGGSVANGITIYNMLRGMPFKLITHNVGNVNSIGNVIYLAGEKRYACPQSSFMFHGVGFDINERKRLEEKQLKELMTGLESDQGLIANIINERTDIDAKETASLFFEAVRKGPDYAVEKGITHDILDVDVPHGAPLLQLVFQR